jgi:hypothetical protein
MQQIVVAKCMTIAGNHLRRTLLVANPSQDGTLMTRNPTTTSSAMIQWARVIMGLVYAIKPLLNASLAIEVQAMTRTLIIGKVSAPKHPRHLKMILKDARLYGIVVENTRWTV